MYFCLSSRKRRTKTTKWVHYILLFYNPLELLSMSSVAERLSFADNESAINWLRKNKVPVHRVGVKNLCYQIDFDHAAAKPLVNQILKDHPQDWETVLEEIIPNDILLRKIIRNLPTSRVLSQAVTRRHKQVVPTNKNEEKLFKMLSSL